MTLLIFGSILLLLALIPATGIFLTYRRVDWRSSKIGRVMHGKSLAIVVVLWLNSVGALLLLLDVGRPQWFELLRIAAFGFVTIMLWRQWRLYRSIVGNATHEQRHNGDPAVVSD